MKFILIAVYLGSGVAPTMETREFSDKAACHSLASDYIKQVKVGQARAFCLPMK